MFNILRKYIEKCGPLAPVVAFFGTALVLLFISRITLTLLYWPRLSAINDFWLVFPIGIRMDIVTLSLMLMIPAILIMILPHSLGRLWKPVIAGLLTALACLLVYMEITTPPFIDQYDSRPNRIFVEYLVYPKEVFGTLWADHKLALIISTILTLITIRYSWRVSNHLLHHHAHWSYLKRLLILPFVVISLAAGARSSFDHRPANISTAAYTNDHLTNEMGLNSTYSMLYAVYSMKHEKDATKVYGENMPEDEMYRRIYSHMQLPDSAFPDSELPLLHHQTSHTPRQQPYNLVIFLQESLGAEYVGSLNGLPLTPNIDQLSKEGLFLTNLYSTGTRTVRGIEATISGFLPTPGRSVVKLGLSQYNFFTIAQLLKQHHYKTDFIYGGASHFDNMRSFFLGNGFDRIIDEPDFDETAFHGTWGVSDIDLVRKANETFVAHGDTPFFALMLSTTNHAPFEFPEGHIDLYEEPANTVHNAMKFADYAIGEFFRLAKQEDYYKNTIFMVVADHNTRVYGADLVPVHKFHIPGLIIGPGIEPQYYSKLASQIDLLPTLLDLMGLDTTHPMIGHNLIELSNGDPGHAFMQYGLTNAFRVGDQVIIHQPSKEPAQFLYQDNRLIPTTLDPELARDALAHIQLPTTLYSQQKYRLPNSQ